MSLLSIELARARISEARQAESAGRPRRSARVIAQRGRRRQAEDSNETERRGVSP